MGSRTIKKVLIEMDNRFTTNYDWLQALLGTLSFIVLLSINLNLGTIILASIIFVFGIYKAFGRKITFKKSEVEVVNFYSRFNLEYKDVEEAMYVTNLYGRSFIRLLSKGKVYKGYLSFSNWRELMVFLHDKGVHCNELR